MRAVTDFNLSCPRSRNHQSYFVICQIVGGWTLVTWLSVQCSQDLCPKGLHDKQCHLKSIQINPFVNEKIAIEIAIFKTLQLSKNGIFQFMVSFHIRSETCFAHSSFQRDFCLITKIRVNQTAWLFSLQPSTEVKM